MKRATSILTAWGVATALLLSGCGGGSGPASGEDGPAGGEPPSAGTGSLAVTLGDDPTQQYDEILLTVTEISLQGSDAPIILLDDSITVDLLQLDSATELLALVDEVPVGDYNRLFLQVERIDLNTLDDQGNVATSEQARVLANGRVNLNPRGGFTLGEDQSLIVQLDMDARRSFQLTQTGAAGQVLFRPVVFVDVLTVDDVQRLSFLSGNLRLLGGTEGDGAFELCDVEPVSGREVQPREGCLRVSLADDPSIFDAEAEPTELGTFTDGDSLIVGGRVASGNSGLQLQAAMIQAGDRDSFTRLGGTLEEAATDEGFRLLRDDADAVEVVLQPGAILFDHTGAAVEVDALAAGTRVRAMGVLSELEAANGEVDAAVEDEGEVVRALEVLRATAVGADLRETGSSTVTGIIDGVSNGTVQLLVDGDGLCIGITDDTRITVFESGGDGSGSREGELADLELGLEMEADLSEDTDAEGCSLATDVVLQPADLADEV